MNSFHGKSYTHNLSNLLKRHAHMLFTRGGWVVKEGQNSVYVVIEWPLTRKFLVFLRSLITFESFEHRWKFWTFSWLHSIESLWNSEHWNKRVLIFVIVGPWAVDGWKKKYQPCGLTTNFFAFLIFGSFWP